MLSQYHLILEIFVKKDFSMWPCLGLLRREETNSAKYSSRERHKWQGEERAAKGQLCHFLSTQTSRPVSLGLSHSVTELCSSLPVTITTSHFFVK